jgi:hypothetical protein
MAYFYFDYQNQAHQSMTYVISSFLKQLSTHQDDVSPSLRALHYKFRNQATLPELSELLECMKESIISFSFTFIILDGLDECDINQRSKLLNLIKQWTSMAFKIYATSRPHLRDVQEFFKVAPTILIQADVHDIENYLTIQVKERMTQNQMLKRRVVDTLSTRADGM